MLAIRTTVPLCLFTFTLLLAGTAAAQDIGLPPVTVPGFSLVGQASFMDTIVPNEPLPSLPVPLLPVPLPSVTAGAGSIRVCGADDGVQLPALPVAPPSGLPVQVQDLDLVPCQVSGGVDATDPCSPASPVLTSPAGASLVQAAGTADNALGNLPVAGPAFRGRALVSNVVVNCSGSTPGIFGVAGNDPSNTKVEVVDELPVCPYPALAPTVPCERVPVNQALNQAVTDAGSVPLGRGGCTFTQVYVDCGVVTTPQVVVPVSGQDPVTVQPQSVSTGQTIREAFAAMPAGGNVPVGPVPTDASTPGVAPVTINGQNVGSLGQCRTPGLPGPGEGALPGVPLLHAWVNQTGSQRETVFTAIDALTANPPRDLLPATSVPSQVTPVGTIPGTTVGPLGTPAELRALLQGLPRTDGRVFNTDLPGPATQLLEQTYGSLNRQAVNEIHRLWPFPGPGGQPGDAGCTGSGTSGSGAVPAVVGLPAEDLALGAFNQKILAIDW